VLAKGEVTTLVSPIQTSPLHRRRHTMTGVWRLGTSTRDDGAPQERRERSSHRICRRTRAREGEIRHCRRLLCCGREEAVWRRGIGGDGGGGAMPHLARCPPILPRPAATGHAGKVLRGRELVFSTAAASSAGESPLSTAVTLSPASALPSLHYGKRPKFVFPTMQLV
jgi:hypothetical protein